MEKQGVFRYRQQMLIIQNTYTLGADAGSFKHELLRLPEVKGATMTGYLPTSDGRNDNVFFLTPELDIKKAISMQDWNIDNTQTRKLIVYHVVGVVQNFQFPLAGGDAVGVIPETE